MSREFINKETLTKLTLDGEGKLFVERWQDAQDIADHASFLRDQPQHGADFHHVWSAPNTLVEQMYQDYCGTDSAPKEMNQEFWQYMHKRMKDPQYSKFWTKNPSNPFHTGYTSPACSNDLSLVTSGGSIKSNV